MDDLHEYTLKFSRTKKITKRSLRQAFLAKKRLASGLPVPYKLENYKLIKESKIISAINNFHENGCVLRAGLHVPHMLRVPSQPHYHILWPYLLQQVSV